MKNKPYYLPGSILLLFLLCITIYSCRKDLLLNAHDQPAAAFSISSAKGWYQQQYPANGGKKTASTGTETKTDISQIIQPDWDAPEVYSRRGAEVLETPAASGDYLLGIKSDNGNSYDARNSHSRFVLLKKDGEIKAYVMTLIADSAYLNGDKSKLEQNSFNKRDENFSGLVIYHTPKGDFVSGWVYQNGTLLRKMSDRTPAQQQEAAAVRKKQTQAVKEQNVSECVTYDIYQTYCEWGGTPDNPYEVFHGCWDEYIGSQTVCNTSGGSTGGGTGGGGSTGGGGTTNPPPCKTPNPNINVSSTKSTGGLKTNFVQPPPPVDDGGFPDPADPGPCTPVRKISNNVSNPCLKKQVQAAIDKDITYNLGETMNSIFGASTQFNITFFDAPSTAFYRPTIDGVTDIVTAGERTIGKRTIFTSMQIEIQLNKDRLMNASKEYIAATIIHEAFHAYLSKIKAINQHFYMANSYVTYMATQLQVMFPNLSDFDAQALSWGGLELDSGSGYGSLSTATKNQIQLINTGHRTGEKGTPCAK